MERKEYSLFELNGLVKQSIRRSFPATCWIRAEMSDVRVNASSGHCYLEFIEKHPISGQLLAKARASIWSNTYRTLAPYFEQSTGQRLTSGIKVLVNVSVEFHELYGFSLTVLDIDPAYTLGDMVRRRMEIVKQLKEEGIYTLNKELTLTDLPQRIAIITSPVAAGYEDFMMQLTHNKRGYQFYTKLYPSIMQGDQTEAQVIKALDRIYLSVDKFDAVVIIRGGGATSDLNSFDSYALAANCAQFPLPIITGIGHERDDTVIDLVAHTRAKTPTAVAEFLVECISRADEMLITLQQQCSETTQALLQAHQNSLQQLTMHIPTWSQRLLEKQQTTLQSLGQRLPNIVQGLLNEKQKELTNTLYQMQTYATRQLEQEKAELQLTEQFIRMASPTYLLQKGYTLTVQQGKIIKQAADVVVGATLVTHFADGTVSSKATAIQKKIQLNN